MRTFGIFAALAAVSSVFATPMPVAESSTIAGARRASVVARQDAEIVTTEATQAIGIIPTVTAEFPPAGNITAGGISTTVDSEVVSIVDQIHDKVSDAVNSINVFINNSTYTSQDKVDQATNVLTNLISGVVQLVGFLITGAVGPTANDAVNNSTDSVGFELKEALSSSRLLRS